jgi:hypothetical protein
VHETGAAKAQGLAGMSMISMDVDELTLACLTLACGFHQSMRQSLQHCRTDYATERRINPLAAC